MVFPQGRPLAAGSGRILGGLIGIGGYPALIRMAGTVTELPRWALYEVEGELEVENQRNAPDYDVDYDPGGGYRAGAQKSAAWRRRYRVVGSPAAERSIRAEYKRPGFHRINHKGDGLGTVGLSRNSPRADEPPGRQGS